MRPAERDIHAGELRQRGWAWHDDGGNTRGGLLQAGQTHFTHTPTRGNTPLFAPAPSSDHGMRKLRGSVIRAARTTGQTQQQWFSHSAPCQGSACFAHACEPGSLVAGDPAATCLWSEPAAAVVQRVLRCETSGRRPAADARLCSTSLPSTVGQPEPDTAMSQPGRWLRRESELAYDGWCFFAYAHTHGAVRYIQHGAHTILTYCYVQTRQTHAA